jgi:hypothetical protein
MHERPAAAAPVDMIDYLSPREARDLEAAAQNGAVWPPVIGCFLDGARLLLGWDYGLSEVEIARRAAIDRSVVRGAIDEAVRFCVERKLHLLGWQETDGAWTYFMAVG